MAKRQKLPLASFSLTNEFTVKAIAWPARQRRKSGISSAEMVLLDMIVRVSMGGRIRNGGLCGEGAYPEGDSTKGGTLSQ